MSKNTHPFFETLEDVGNGKVRCEVKFVDGRKDAIEFTKKQISAIAINALGDEDWVYEWINQQFKLKHLSCAWQKVTS